MTDDEIKELIPFLDNEARMFLIKDQLGKRSDNSLGDLIDVSRGSVSYFRKKHNIAPFDLPGWAKKLDRKMLLDLIQQGLTDEEIAQKTGRSANNIGRIRADEFNIYRGPKKTGFRFLKHDAKVVKAILDMKAKGVTLKGISKSLNISKHTIASILKREARRKQH